MAKILRYGIILVILAIIGFFYFKSIPPKNSPIIEIIPDRYDFGVVSQAKGVVSSTMEIRNSGNKELILDNLDTSCGCTTASVIKDGVEGPRFSMAMHGSNPRNWKVMIAPGGSAQLKVYYDPNVHKDLQGQVSRSVYVYSNDPRNPRKEVRIGANQVI